MNTGKDPCTVANAFIQKGIDADDHITHMEVQKLMFFAHGWMLGQYGRPLHYHQWEAWKYGPVLPVVYHNLSYFRARPINEIIRFADAFDFDEEEQGVIDLIYDGFRPLGASRLSRLTHAKGFPMGRRNQEAFWG